MLRYTKNFKGGLGMEEHLHIDSASIASLLGTVGSPLIVISELIKNAIDAAADNIKICYNRKSETISVVDDGHGFSLDEIRHLSTPGFSNKKNNGNLTNAKGTFYTGSKGLGILSVFSLCDHLTIQTKSSADGEYIINWSKDTGSYSYEHVLDSQMHIGTKITLKNIYPQVITGSVARTV
jgi:HSP90 family molecular chaperone